MSDQENENVFFLQGLSEELNEENKKLNQSTSQLTFLMEKMKKELNFFKVEVEDNQKSFQEEVIDRLDVASHKLSEKAYQAFTEKTLKDSNDAIKGLREISFKASTQITEVNQKTKFCFKKLSAFIIGASLVGGVIGGVIGGTVMRYFPKFDDYVEERYTWGRALERSWKDLSKKEKEKIQKLLIKNSPK